MFGIDGQYLLDFSLGEKSNFIQAVEFDTFELTEVAGNMLPQFILKFASSDQEVQSRFNEGTVLKAIYGQNQNSLQNIELIICTSNADRMADGKRFYTLEGLANKLDYVNVNRMRHSDKISSLELFPKVLSSHFNLDTNVSKSNDQQVWIQNSLTDRNFIQHLWLHTDLGDSFPLIGISSLDNAFIVRDAHKLFSSQPRWRFTTNPQADNEIHYEAGYRFRNSSAVFNSMRGYSRTDMSISREEGEDISFKPTPSPALSTSAKFNRRSGANPRIGSVQPLTQNMHANYHVSYSHNTQSLMLFSSFRGDLSFRGRFVPIRVLDLVMFRDEDSSRLTDEYSSGLFVVSRVSRVFNAQQHGTFVTLTRESPGGMKGSFA